MSLRASSIERGVGVTQVVGSPAVAVVVVVVAVERRTLVDVRCCCYFWAHALYRVRSCWLLQAVAAVVIVQLGVRMRPLLSQRIAVRAASASKPPPLPRLLPAVVAPLHCCSSSWQWW